MAAVSLHTIQE